MIELKPCCTVPYPEKLFEQYEIGERSLRANVGISKVGEMMLQFIETHDEPLFFILELPTRQKDEPLAPKGGASQLHNDVYYLDGCTADEARRLLDLFGELLICDGMNTFGFGGHVSQDEMLFGKYNVMTVFTAYTGRYSAFFEQFGLERCEVLVSAWDTVEAVHPGECRCCELNGKTVYDIPDALASFGLYLAERREE